jgi:hypothetical protein
MGRRWWMKWYSWAILVAHVFAILIFTRGFLLTRTELPYYSHGSDISQSPCFSSTSTNHSWNKPVVDRLVIIVLDAIRFFISVINHFLFIYFIYLIIVIYFILFAFSGLISLLRAYFFKVRGALLIPVQGF